MKKIIILAIILLSFTSDKGMNNKINIAFAISRIDNDFVSYKDSQSPKIETPVKVKQHLYRYVQNFIDKKFPENNFYLFKIKYNERIDIYVLKCYYQLSIWYSVFAYNSINYTITDKPVILEGKWIENSEMGFVNKIFSGRLIDLIDLNTDGTEEVVLRERVHNGNIYNSVIDKYYQLLPDMSFKLLICNESTSLSFDNILINRTLFQNKITSVILNKDGINQVIGTISLDPNTNIINEKKIQIPEYQSRLITTSGIDDIKFIKNGYPISY